MTRPEMVLVSSISRSGGTFTNALFDGTADTATFPIEFPFTNRQFVDFIKPEIWSPASSLDNWLGLTSLEFHLREFERLPYDRSFGRRKVRSDPKIQFDFAHFRKRVQSTILDAEDIGGIYHTTWKSFFESIKVDGRPPHGLDTGINRFTNYFAYPVIRPYEGMKAAAADICDLKIIHVVREPLENVASAFYHMPFAGLDPGFGPALLARWEMAFLTALRNCIMFPQQCAFIKYSPDTENMRDQFANSPMPFLNMQAGRDLRPTLLGIPMWGQSYKEKRNLGTVASAYDYEQIFSAVELAAMKQKIKYIFDNLGIGSLDDITPSYTPNQWFEDYCATGHMQLDHQAIMLAPIIQFPAKLSVNFRDDLRRYLSDKGIKGILAAIGNGISRRIFGTNVFH